MATTTKKPAGGPPRLAAMGLNIPRMCNMEEPKPAETEEKMLNVSQSAVLLNNAEVEEAPMVPVVLAKKPSVTPRGLAGARPATAKPLSRPGFNLSSILGKDRNTLLKEKADKLTRKQAAEELEVSFE